MTRPLPQEPAPPMRIPAACLDLTGLDQVTGPDLAARRAWLLRVAGTAVPGAATAALALAAVTAQREARAQADAIYRHRGYQCGCGQRFTGLAAIEEHLDTSSDDGTHYERACTICDRTQAALCTTCPARS